MNMITDIIIIVLAISLLLYVLLGGADFGGGIVEFFSGKKSIHTISKAIAPVWEANHIWLILAIVILFNGFPIVYTTITTYLHIPLLFVLIGITVRGTSFIFRYYDIKDETQRYYTFLFQLSSLITPIFLGIVLGAIVLGNISTDYSAGFYHVYIHPWLNWFTIATGFFVCVLFGWIASVYLIGEASTDEEQRSFVQYSILLFLMLFALGATIFILAEFYHISLFKKFTQSPVGLATVVLATLLIPIFWYTVKLRYTTFMRFSAGAIVGCVFLGWFAVQLPVMVFMKNGPDLTVSNTRAPDATLYFLFYALVVGVLIIFPAFFYLLKVFKFNKTAMNE